MLEQAGFGVFVEALELRIYDPNVLNTPMPIIL